MTAELLEDTAKSSETREANMRSIIVAVLLSIVLVGCGGKEAEHSAAAGKSACSLLKISGGEDCATAASAVMQLSTPQGERTLLCTGTLISPNVLITAYHCIEGRTGEPTVSASSGVVETAVGVAGVDSFAATRHPGQDLALVVMAPGFSERAAAAPMPIGIDAEPPNGFPLTVYGFGYEGSPSPYPSGSSATYLQGYWEEGGNFFDAALHSGIVCQADSGAPAVDDDRMQLPSGAEIPWPPAVIGVLTQSSYTDGCSGGSSARFTRISGYNTFSLIRSIAPDFYWIDFFGGTCSPESLCK